MDTTSILLQLYIASAAIGSIVICASAALGFHHGGSGAGHHGVGHGPVGHGPVGHTGVGHSGVGHAGNGHGLAAQGSHLAQHNIGHFAHSIGHGPAAGHGPQAGHGARAVGHHSASSGYVSGHAQTQPPAGAENLNNTGYVLQNVTASFPQARLRNTQRIEKVLSLINPMMWSFFLTYLGLAGIILLQVFPLLGVFTLVPATLFALLITRTTTNFVSYCFAHLSNSSAVQMDDLVGRMAEVTVPIDPGRVGEVMYISQMKRFNTSARGQDDSLSFKKGQYVMICERSGPNLLVSEWNETFIDPNYQINSGSTDIIASPDVSANSEIAIANGGTSDMEEPPKLLTDGQEAEK